MAIELNRAALADHFGVSLPTVDRWVKDGMPIKQRGSKGIEWKFDLAACIAWWGDRRARDAAGEAPDAMTEIDKRTAQAKMLRAELELAKERGDVAPIRDYEKAWAKAFAQVCANIMNVPQRVVIQLLGETDETVFKDKLRAELNLALQQSAEADIDLADEDDTSSDDD